MNFSRRDDDNVMEVPPYSVLAQYYDEVMSHIDYKVWIQYFEELCNHHNIAPRQTIDISCGTGRTIPYMLPWSGTLYCMDQSPEMVKILYQRFPEMQSRTWVGEMSAFPTRLKFDLVVNIQDSVNYYLKPDRITQHLDNVREQLTPHGAFLFDLSTEENIRNNFIDMDEIFETDTFGYERINTYLPRKRLNISRFYLWQGEDPKKQTYLEKHLQRMYTIDEIEQCLENSMFTDWVLYADETFEPATEKSERIHVIAMK